jgi:predicted house-cleaning noncanonical NTP pyrophosphatase (MazG superfamily)
VEVVIIENIFYGGIPLPVYNKLVRDKIPEIIESNGKEFTTKILSDEEFITELKNKSFEELEEYCDTETREEALEELADLMEIVHAFAKSHGTTLEEVEEIRCEKAERRGAFDEKIFLIEVED